MWQRGKGIIGADLQPQQGGGHDFSFLCPLQGNAVGGGSTVPLSPANSAAAPQHCEQPPAWQLQLDAMPHSRASLSLGWQHHAVAGDTCVTKL